MAVGKYNTLRVALPLEGETGRRQRKGFRRQTQ
jgi:hypothetical protein